MMPEIQGETNCGSKAFQIIHDVSLIVPSMDL